jgi:rhodanese-related sulfurtransferase
MDYKDVAHLEGGMMAWKQDKGPVEGVTFG